MTQAEPREVTTAFGTVIVERAKKPGSHEPQGFVALPSTGRLLAGIALFTFLVLCVVQLGSWPELLDPKQVQTAGRAIPLVVIVGAAVVALTGSAAFVPERLLYVPVAVAAAFVAVVLLSTLTIGGEAWSFGAALLTMSACWVVGGWLLNAMRVPKLADMPPVAWLAGSAAVGMFLLLLGRAGLLRWWTAGVVVLALGVVGLLRLGTAGKPLAGAVRTAVTESRLAAGGAALILLLLGLAAVWTAAPELMFDALYAKAWLPAEWARTGEISSLRDHVILNLYGFAQVLAIPGHLVGAGGVGRYMQWLAVACVPASLWWLLRSRTQWAPLIAAAVAVTPMLFWEATTAYDDALLVLAAVALSQAIVILLERPPQIGALWEGAAVGLLAGACLDLKLHLAWLVAGLVIAYLLLRPRIGAIFGVLAAGLATAGPPVIARGVDIGDPLYPALQGVFHSPYLARGGPIATRAGEGGGQALGSPVEALWHTVVQTDRLFGWPTGVFGGLTLSLLGALVVGVVLRGRGGKGLIAVSMGLALAAVGWYVQLKGPRYLLPTGIVAVMALGLAARGQPLTRRAERVALVALAVGAVALWPSTVAQFWNVPGKDVPLAAALGLKSSSEYERQSQAEAAALAAFNLDSPPGSTAVSFAIQRAWLSGGRDLQMIWELHDRLLLGGSLPATPAEALRRIRATGTDWALINSRVPREPGFYYLYGTIERYGELRWADGYWTLFHLSDRPRAPTFFPACDDTLSRAHGCWRGRLGGRPGYTSRDPAVRIARTAPVCPGELLTLDIRIEGRGLAPIWIDFDGSDPTRGHARPIVAGDTTARVGGTAPPGATQGTVTIPRPPPGMRVSLARLGHLGGCEPHAS